MYGIKKLKLTLTGKNRVKIENSSEINNQGKCAMNAFIRDGDHLFLFAYHFVTKVPITYNIIMRVISHKTVKLLII
jgi:hypothetical protein